MAVLGPALAAAPKPNTDTYALKVAISHMGRTEYFWITPFTRTGETFSAERSTCMSENHLIRPARAGEARLISDLALRSKAHWGYSTEFMEAVRAELSYNEKQIQSEQARFFVLDQAGSAVGFYALAHQSGTDIELDALFVEPGHIGQGFGRVLIEHAKATAAKMGATRLIIQGDPNAERFYVAAGAVVTGTRESSSIPGRFLPTFAIDLR